MGSQIAAHCVNAGFDVLLLDIAPTELTTHEAAKGLTLDSKPVRNRIVNAGMDAAKKIKPAAFFSSKPAGSIRAGNFDDDLGQLSGVDWVIEAVVEKLEVKRDLFGRVEKFLKPNAIISSNT